MIVLTLGLDVMLRLLVFVCISFWVVSAESNADLQLYQKEDNKTQEKQINSSTQKDKKVIFEGGILVSEGNSEAELELNNPSNNPHSSRVGANVGLKYPVRLNSRIGFSFFISNSLELNSQIRGSKAKVYFDGTNHDGYDYGHKIMYSSWTSSVGFIFRIFKNHSIILKLRQTQYLNNGGMRANIALQENIPLGNVLSLADGVVPAGLINDIKPLFAVTHIFLIYSYIF